MAAPLVRVCVRWAAQHGYAVVPKSSNPGRMAQNLRVFGEGQTLSDADMALLDGLMTPEMMVKWREHYESRRSGDPPPQEGEASGGEGKKEGGEQDCRPKQ